MACECGRRTTRSGLCRLCALDDRAEEAARVGRQLVSAECPTCGGPTSGTGVECAECRVGADAGVGAGGE